MESSTSLSDLTLELSQGRDGRGQIHSDIEDSILFWKTFDFEEKRASWDKICNEMRDYKASSISGRKRLNDLTKAFRSKNKEEQLINISELLKAYQEEIDQLSRRSRFTETSYLALYKCLYDAPDPSPVIDSLLKSASKNSVHSLEVERLQAEIRQYDDEFQRLKNQEVTIRKLEEQLLGYIERGEETVALEVSRREQELRENANREIQEAMDLAKAAERRMQQAIESERLAQQATFQAQAQLFEARDAQSTKFSSLEVERDQLADFNLRLQLQVVELQNELLHLQTLRDNSVNNTSMPSVAESSNSISLQLQQARESLSAAEDSLRDERTMRERKEREHKELLAIEREKNMRLQKELDSRISPEEVRQLKRRIRALISLNFSYETKLTARKQREPEEEVCDDNNQRVLNQDYDSDCDTEALLPLEALLAGKVRSQDSLLASLRTDLQSVKSSEASLVHKCSSLQTALDKSKSLVERLEAELDARDKIALVNGSGSELNRREESDSLATLLGDRDYNKRGNNSSSNSSSATANANGLLAAQQMINVLQAQRDRQREKLTYLEGALLAANSQIESLATARAQLEADNVNLFRRLKFAQSQQVQVQNAALAASSGGFAIPRQREESRLGDDDIETRYNGLYEQRLNPFDLFSHSEKQRKLRELSVADRIVLNTTMAIISNNFGRNALLLYLAAMHLLVFGSIYYTAHSGLHCEALPVH